MPSILRDLPAVAWLAGKNFNLHGKSYKVGDEVPEINEFPRLEVFVRNRFVIPIVESTEDIPFQFRHVVMTRERAIRKLQMGNAGGDKSSKVRAEHTIRNLETKDSAESATVDDGAGENEFNPKDHNMDEVMEYVEEHPDEILSVYALEESKEPRPRLLKKLDEILNQQAEEENKEEHDD